MRGVYGAWAVLPAPNQKRPGGRLEGPLLKSLSVQLGWPDGTAPGRKHGSEGTTWSMRSLTDRITNLLP